MSGHVGDLSETQEKALNSLKEKVADIHRPDYDDYYYLRWLRARQFDVKKAEQMMRKDVQWRKRISADFILTDYTPPEVLEKYYPRGYLGLGKDGCPVRVMPFKMLDLRGCAMSVPKSELLKFITYVFEQDIDAMKKENERLGTHIEKHVYILDIDGYTFGRATDKYAVDTLNELLKLYEAHYPERLKMGVFINAPTYFSFVMSLSRPFISDETYKKFKIFGRDGYQQTLLDIIDADLLPAYLGGRRTDPDGSPMCNSIITYGGFIPRKYYYNKSNIFVKQEGVESFHLKTRSSHFIEIQVNDPNTKLEWEIMTLNNDIGIGLFYTGKTGAIQAKEKNFQEILPVQKVNCHIIPETGFHICEKPGRYFIKLDNSFSWFTAKSVYYKTSLLPLPDLSTDM